MEITWESLCEREPRLIDLLKEAQRLRRNRPLKYYPGDTWYHNLKPKMSDLVGYGSTDEVLSTSQAYDLVYQKLYHALRND